MRMPERIDLSEGRRLFGDDPAGYDAIRPPYPEPVYEFLQRTGALRRDVATLEIGAGSGVATRRLVELGANPLVAVEPDARFAALLRNLVRRGDVDLEVVESAFEDVSLDAGEFDLVASATAFHWLDPREGLRKVGRILRPGGFVALWWNVFGDPARSDPFHDATQKILAGLSDSPSVGDALPFALDVANRRADFEGAGLFEPARYFVHAWTLVLDSGQVRRLYGTFSAISRLSTLDRESVLDALQEAAEREFAGVVERNMMSPVYVARRART